MRPMTSTTRARLCAAAVLAVAVPTAAAPALAQSERAVATPVAATTATPAATTQAAAPARRARTSLRVGSTRRTVVLGGRTVVTGRLRGASSAERRPRVLLQRRAGAGWTTIARDRTTRSGQFRLRYAPASTGTMSVRVRFSGSAALRRSSRALGRVNVYRRAFASWYGPGLYGNKLACGGTLSAGTLGVAHKTLPCGTKLTLRHGSRSVRVSVVDLTAATKARLGFGSTGTVLSTR